MVSHSYTSLKLRVSKQFTIEKGIMNYSTVYFDNADNKKKENPNGRVWMLQVPIYSFLLILSIPQKLSKNIRPRILVKLWSSFFFARDTLFITLFSPSKSMIGGH